MITLRFGFGTAFGFSRLIDLSSALGGSPLSGPF